MIQKSAGISDKSYRVYDVKVCKQFVTGGKVDTEDEDTLKFFESLTDDEAEHMHFQAHSHVNFDTGASGTDMENQSDVVRNMGKSGFYIFQIWNKKGDISTYLYDLDNNIFYDSKDVELDIEDEMGSLSDFVESTRELVVEKKVYPYQVYQSGYQYQPEKKKKGKKKGKEEDSPYLSGYWDGRYPAYERWDW